MEIVGCEVYEAGSPFGFRQWVVHEHGESKTNDIAEHINLSPARTRALQKDRHELQHRVLLRP